MNVTEMTPKASARLNRIRLVARFFKWICIIGLGIMIFCAAMAILMPDMVFPSGSSGKTGLITITGPILLEQFKTGWKWLYPLIWVGLAFYYCLGIWFFYRLFGNLERGVIFDRDNVRCIRFFGWWLIVCPLFGLGFELSKFIWMVPRPGNIIQMDFSDLGPVLMRGFFVILAAWIMDEGRKIQEEQELTV